MAARQRLQKRLDRAFDNYLSLTNLLREDLESMWDTRPRPESKQWRRNFVRATAALLEGHAHCLRDMCLVALSTEAPAVSSKERAVILQESRFSAEDRIKYTLRAAYKLHSLLPLPDFSGSQWARAQRFLRKRHRLMHPKLPRDLGVSDRTWTEMRSGMLWLAQQFFDFLVLLHAKHVD